MDRPSEDSGSTKWVLEKEHEFRFEIDHGTSCTIQLVNGTAECFGTEMSVEKKYKLTAQKGAIFTWHGCTLSVSSDSTATPTGLGGTTGVQGYVANETPMLTYATLHDRIHEARLKAEQTNEPGPNVILVGPTDAGKSSLAKILLGYAARMGSQPIFVDLDIGQGSITVPGAIGATPVDRPIDIEEGFASGMPVAFFYGHVSLDANPHLYKKQVSLLNESIEKRKASSPEARASGTIINTCGWVDGLGYELLLDAIDSMKADHIVVLDHERLYNDLMRVYQKNNNNVQLGSFGSGPSTQSTNVNIFKLSKSGGVVTRPPAFRRKARMNRVREYFYGISGDLCPHSTVVDFKDVVIYQIGGGPAAPLSALPIGAEPTIDPVRMEEISPSPDLLHSVVAVSHATEPDEILRKNVAGFLYVTDVNVERHKITVLAPCPGPLPSKYLILGTLKWLE